jgi:hypothetical protein
MFALLWGLAGWCGTPWRHWFPPPPPPGPDPWWAVKIFGVIGGVAAGWLFHTMDSTPMPGIVAAFIGGRVLSDIGAAFLPQRKA